MINRAMPPPEAALKARRPLPREQLRFTAMLILLSILAVLLWFKDPEHQYSGHSRVGWPPPAQPKS
jgi:hypothetical protein